MITFSNSYAQLGDVFCEKTRPTPVAAPQLIMWNSALAEQLMVPNKLTNDREFLAEIFSGNHILPSAKPIAAAYAGHQFGHFVPQLGDGRAHLLGELSDKQGNRWDIQLKGSGRTSFSRGGDGRCAIGPAIREYIMSEAMSALRIPTTRCLAVVNTGELVQRETILPGAIVTRVAASHIRVGTFEFFAARRDYNSVKTLCQYTIDRHYPELKQENSIPYIRLINKVIDQQIKLIVAWMRVGFIHGVMNTDNTAISGETIDYGPCAMMGSYDPNTVYSSIDHMGRYAYANQLKILQWNMVRFIECLLPLINPNVDKAKNQLTPLIAEIPERIEQKYIEMLAKKLGLSSLEPNDKILIDSILNQLKNKKLDYTVTFDQLTKSIRSKDITTQMHNQLGEVFNLWKTRIEGQDMHSDEVQKLMRQHNPVVIPRNHHVEKAIQQCEQTGQTTLAERFLQVLSSPYIEQEHTSAYQDPASDGDINYHTYCGT